MDFDPAHASVISIRLAAALVVGALLGVNRDLHRKAAGLRTVALVSVGSAILVLVGIELGGSADSVSRILQGLVVGVGFLGAGVIVHHESEQRVEGLTTAASVWVAAGLGAACGAGLGTVALVSMITTMLILLFGGKVERVIEKLFMKNEPGKPESR
jgi:putative Mg2+ transporter-C (MgtC) family protein